MRVGAEDGRGGGPSGLPSGEVTFAFVDVVDSTALFSEHGEQFVGSLRRLLAMVRSCAERAGGVVVKTEGDGAFLVFAEADQAVQALVEMQSMIEDGLLDGSGPGLRVRAGAHTGWATPVEDDYVSLAVNIAARVAAAAGTGQVLVSARLIEKARRAGSPGAVGAVDAGQYLLKGIAEPVTIYRVHGRDELPRATPYRRTNVAASRTSFVGRGTNLDAVREAVSRPGLVTLLGPGGAGKTRLVSELALADHNGWPGGMWLVELGAVVSGERVPATVGEALGLPGADVDDVRAELKRRGRILLILDNCEHLTDAAAELADVLTAGCPELTVLATSREPLEVVPEVLLRLDPLPVADAVELFRQRARSAGAVVGTDTDQDDVLRSVCDLLDGLPLAVELAAPYASRLTVDDVRDVVAGGVGELTRRGGPERQRSLTNLLSWSLDRLPEHLRAALLALTVFPGRFDSEMAGSVLAQVSERNAALVLGDLVSKSLVDMDGESYRLLTTVRAVTAPLLAQEPDLAKRARDGLLEWAVAFGDERFKVFTCHDEVPEHSVLAAQDALQYAESTGRDGTGTLWHFFSIVAGFRTDRTPLELAERKSAQSHPSMNSDQVLQLVSALRIIDICSGESLPVRHCEMLREAASRSDDPRLKFEAVEVDARRSRRSGDLTQLERCGLEAERLCEDQRLAGLRPVAWALLAEAASGRGDLDAVIRYYTLSRDFDAAAGQPHLAAMACSNLADAELEQGDIEAALRDAQQALAWARNPRDRATAGAILAQALHRAGFRSEARHAALTALELNDSFLDPESSAEVDRRLREVLQAPDHSPNF